MLIVSSSSRNIFVQGKISVLEDNTILPVPWSSTGLHKSRKEEIKRGEDQCAISVSRFYVLISARTLFFFQVFTRASIPRKIPRSMAEKLTVHPRRSLGSERARGIPATLKIRLSSVPPAGRGTR